MNQENDLLKALNQAIQQNQIIIKQTQQLVARQVENQRLLQEQVSHQQQQLNNIINKQSQSMPRKQVIYKLTFYYYHLFIIINIY